MLMVKKNPARGGTLYLVLNLYKVSSPLWRTIKVTVKEKAEKVGMLVKVHHVYKIKMAPSVRDHILFFSFNKHKKLAVPHG